MVVNFAPLSLRTLRVFGLLGVLAASALAAHASPPGSMTAGGSGGNALGDSGKTGSNTFDFTAPDGGVPEEWKNQVGIDQRLDEKLPGTLEFKDETGKSVMLRDYLGKRPVLVTMLQFTCTQVCSAQMQAMVASLNELQFTAGKEFDLLTVSIDPRETPEIANDAKAEQLKVYDRPGAGKGWHFLTGDEGSIKSLAKAIGYKYVWDAKNQQYVHPEAIVLVTPDGHISRYYMHLSYYPRDLRFGIIQASQDRIGTVVDAIALSCFHYNPVTGKYTFQVMAFLRVLAIATVLGGATGIGLMLWKEKRRMAAPVTEAGQLKKA